MEFPTVSHCQHYMSPWKIGMYALYVSHVKKHLDLKINTVVLTMVLPVKHCSAETNHYTPQFFGALIHGGSTFASALSSLLVHWTQCCCNPFCDIIIENLIVVNL